MVFPATHRFRLAPSFLETYRTAAPPWGPLGLFTYKRTYARDVAGENRSEEWWETVKRVVEGCYTVQKTHCRNLHLPWSDEKAQRSAQEMYRLMFDMKFLPPGRGLWFMGTEALWERGSAALNNCFAAETEILTRDGIKTLGECVGTKQELLVSDGSWVTAPIRSFGEQPLLKVTLSRARKQKVVYCTPDHRWFVEGLHTENLREVLAKDLKPGNRLPQVYPEPVSAAEIDEAALNAEVPHWHVLSVERTDRVEEVFCPVVPGYGNFVLEGNILTGNCAFVSTEGMHREVAEPFRFLMDMSMLGVGVAFDTKGADKLSIVAPRYGATPFVVPDTKEGWCDAVGIVIGAYAGRCVMPPSFDFSEIRPAGAPIKTFGGIAPGPEPLKRCLEEMESVLRKAVGRKLSSTDIVDLMNIIGKCVVSGGVRRTAELVLGCPRDKEYLRLKDPEIHGDELMAWRWASNNSVLAEVGMDYREVGAQTARNGEPGYFWLENARAYGRMKDPADGRDQLVMGTNPCGEQSLCSYEICNLVETFPSRHDSYDQYERTLKYAYLYAKTVTLVPTHNERTNAIMLRNRRIGLSQSGIVENIVKIGRRAHLDWCDRGYEYVNRLDRIYSDWLCIPESIKKTTVKPSGTVSLLPGVTPGIHYPHSEYYIRRIRVSLNSPLWKAVEAAGYPVEPSEYGDGTMVCSFPVHERHFDRAKDEVSIWEQVENAALMQHYWSDNQVSCTVTFRAEEAEDIPRVLEMFEHRLKGISFLPLNDHGYAQAPYETITAERYAELTANLKPIDFGAVQRAEETEKFCDGDSCTLQAAPDSEGGAAA